MSGPDDPRTGEMWKRVWALVDELAPTLPVVGLHAALRKMVHEDDLAGALLVAMVFDRQEARRAREATPTGAATRPAGVPQTDPLASAPSTRPGVAHDGMLDWRDDDG